MVGDYTGLKNCMTGLLAYKALVSSPRSGRTPARRDRLTFRSSKTKSPCADGGTLYNVACAYARAGRPDQALDTLEHALDRAVTNLPWIANDPDWERAQRPPPVPGAPQPSALSATRRNPARCRHHRLAPGQLRGKPQLAWPTNLLPPARRSRVRRRGGEAAPTAHRRGAPQ